jgi:tripartite-type tricarboxylate transporter receptor subunit TctC
MLTSRHATRPLAAGFAMLAAIALSTAGDAVAQPAYPNKPIRIFSITPPGGPSDMSARLIGDKLAAAWGQPVVVEPKVGIAGSLAVGHVAKSPPDGYSLVMSGDAAIVTNLSLYKSISYHPQKDLAPVSQVAFTTNILAVSNDVPAKSVQELVALMRSQPGKFKFAHGGLGFSQHLAVEVFKSASGLTIEQVPYRGGPAIMPDLIAGRVSACFCNITAVLPLARSGKLKALAVTSLKRSQFASELPTMAESGFPGFDVNAWFGLLAPSGTPTSIVDKLYQGTAHALAMQDVRDAFQKLGMEIIGNSPSEFAAVIASEIPQRKKLIETAGIERQ